MNTLLDFAAEDGRGIQQLSVEALLLLFVISRLVAVAQQSQGEGLRRPDPAALTPHCCCRSYAAI